MHRSESVANILTLLCTGSCVIRKWCLAIGLESFELVMSETKGDKVRTLLSAAHAHVRAVYRWKRTFLACVAAADLFGDVAERSIGASGVA